MNDDGVVELKKSSAPDACFFCCFDFSLKACCSATRRRSFIICVNREERIQQRKDYNELHDGLLLFDQ